MISVFEIFKIGVGPSSSHTVGPMKAAKEFSDLLSEKLLLNQVDRLVVDIYGSLSWTGKGHHTDSAILLGLAGNLPATVDLDATEGFLKLVEATQMLPLGAVGHQVAFPASAMVFHDECLPKHENGMVLSAYAGEELLLSKTYYSIGGGIIVDDENFGKPQCPGGAKVPYHFESADEMLALCQDQGISIASLMMKNELTHALEEQIHEKLGAIWQVMEEGVERGMHTEGVLAGPLKVPRRAAALHRKLVASGPLNNDPMQVVDWVNMFALAVSEENAAGGRVVTAPTNGAAGIIPAVLSYYNKFINPLTQDEVTRFYLTAGAIGILYQMNASISGAEVGCQGRWALPAPWLRRAWPSSLVPARSISAPRPKSRWSITLD